MKTESGHSWTFSRSRSLTVSIESLACFCDDSGSFCARGGFEGLSSLKPIVGIGGALCVTISIVAWCSELEQGRSVMRLRCIQASDRLKIVCPGL